MYKCSGCGREIGAMLDRNGQPEMFKCVRSGRIAKAIPQFNSRDRVKFHPPKTEKQKKYRKPKVLATKINPLAQEGE